MSTLTSEFNTWSFRLKSMDLTICLLIWQMSCLQFIYKTPVPFHYKTKPIGLQCKTISILKQQKEMVTKPITCSFCGEKLPMYKGHPPAQAIKLSFQNVANCLHEKQNMTQVEGWPTWPARSLFCDARVTLLNCANVSLWLANRGQHGQSKTIGAMCKLFWLRQRSQLCSHINTC